MTSSPDPAALHLLATVERVRGQLADAAERLRRLGVDAEAVAAITDWQTASARHFHESARGWCADVRALAALAEVSGEDVRWLAARVGAMVWSELG